jgi:hypothetical protein
MDLHQARAKGRLLEEQVLDEEGLAAWLSGFHSLKELWIVGTSLPESRNPALETALRSNLKRGVRLFFFLRKADVQEGGPLWMLSRRWVQDQPTLKTKVQRQVHRIGLEESEARWITSDLVIGNPSDPRARVGFVGIRQERALKFACRMSSLDVEAAVHAIMPFLAKRVPRAIAETPKSRR